METSRQHGRGGVRQRKAPSRSRPLAPHEIKPILERLFEPPPINEEEVYDHRYHSDGSFALGDGPFEARVGRHDSPAYRLLPRICERVRYVRALRLACALTAVCAVGPGAARGARWREFDKVAKTWTFPAARVETGVPGDFPPVALSSLALKILCAAHVLGDGAGLVFKRKRGIENGGFTDDEFRERFSLPCPPPPSRDDLVFPGKRGEPLEEHALRELLHAFDPVGVPAVRVTPQEFEQAYEHWRGTLANKPRRRSPSEMSQWAAAIWPGWGGP